MRNIISKKNNTRLIRVLAGLIAAIAIIICGFKIATAVQYNAITVQGTTGDITVKGNQIDELKVSPAIVFNKTGDSITYQMTLSDPDSNKFRITNITDDNTNAYVTTSYQYDKAMDAKDKPILITLAYSNYVPLGDELNLKDIHIIISVDDTTTDQSPDTTSGLATPNTGVDGSKYIKLSEANESQPTLPYIIIAIVSVATIATIMPASRKRRIQFGKLSAIILGITFSEMVMFNVSAKTTTIELTISGSSISATPSTANPQEVVSVTFPNIYNGNQAIYQERADYATTHGKSMAPGNNIIIKTLDNKYVMMDTGPNFASLRENIYNELKKLQGTEKVHLDYLVISHLDGDHNGNAVALLRDNSFEIDNLIFKTEVYPGQNVAAFVKNAITAAQENGTNVITSGGQDAINYLNSISVTNYRMLTEGETFQIGKYLKLDFFNTSNVYSGKYCRTGYTLGWTANIRAANLYKNANGEYVYFDGSEYQTSDGEYDLRSSKFAYSNVDFKTTTTPVAKEGSSGINRYFYATDSSLNDAGSDTHDICVRNPNSYGILAEVTTTGLSKYMYFSGDIENAGYGTLSSGANSSQLYDEIKFENGDFKASEFNYSIPSEDNTAIAIRNKLYSDADAQGLSRDSLLNNIVIYQMSHHGINNSEKALWALNLNRSNGVYAIEESSANMLTSNDWRMNKTYSYTLGNLPAEHKLRVGGSTISSGTVTNAVLGVGCSINSNGATTCVQY